MANVRFIRCAKCGCDATPTKSEVGTSTKMRCPDCGERQAEEQGEHLPSFATMCRECCLTGHQTHAVRVCECENSKCDHDDACNRTPSQNVATIHGTFTMCETCAYRIPDEFLKH
jgi:hypothetical protein